MPYQPTVNFKLSDGRDLGSLGWITKEYLMTVYPQIAGQLITPELWTWGLNSSGQRGTTATGGTPVTTSAGGANWKSLACGDYHTTAIKTDGTLWIWGSNLYGQLGNNTTSQRTTPVTTFSGGTDWKQVACGGNHTAAIKTDGTLWIWGRNSYGQLGINLSGGTTGRTTPVTTFAGGTNWKQVACGGNHIAAVKTDGTLWTWGVGGGGNLGNNTTTNRSTPVTTFAGGTNWKQAACGYNHTASIKTDGTLWTWGGNSYGQLGDNTTTQRNTPVTTFAGGTNWKQAACNKSNNADSLFNTGAVKIDGTLWIWGSNYYGALGINAIGAGTQRITPVTSFHGGGTGSGPLSWKQVVLASGTTFALRTDGTLWSWGWGNAGQHASGISNTTYPRPLGSISGETAPFGTVSTWKQVDMGYGHVAAIRTSDDLQGI